MLDLQTKKIYRDHIITPHSIVVVFDYGPPETVLASNPKFEELKGLLRSGDTDRVPEVVNDALRIHVSTNGKFTVLNGCVVIDGQPLPIALSSRLLEMVNKGEDTTRLENFWDNLAQNPTNSARQDLYDFLVANNVPITKDGCFIVYKKVSETFWDLYTGKTFCCMPGNIIEMPREEVDHDRTNTCSAGLHVAAFEYAHNFSGTKLVECKVNPRDVVAVPPDYGRKKMRVCRAEVLRETDVKFTESSYDEDEANKRLVDRVTHELLQPGSSSRLRIPGRLIRQLGVGVASEVEVVHECSGDDFLIVRALTPEDDTLNAYTSYVVDKDNSIRLSREVLDWAGLVGNVVDAIVGVEPDGSPPIILLLNKADL